MKTTFNPYKIYWAILNPVSGIARREDRKLFFKYAAKGRARKIMIHAPTKQDAIAKVEAQRGRLKKEYTVLLITDKQFGMIKDCCYSVATNKQLNEIFTVS